MLVLTRRENEKIVFPAVDTTVEVLEVKAGRVRLGIKAPKELQILREEVMQSDAQRAERSGVDAFAMSMLRKTKHQIRNQLNSATVGLALARRQLKAGLTESLEVTLDRIGHGFENLEQQVEGLVEQARPTPVQRQPEALLVEDDSNECELLAGFLRMAGYRVNTAGDGTDAIDHLRNGCSPDVMLLDMNMPRCDGATTVRMIRQDPALSRLKIFAVTGYSPSQLGIEPEAMGIDGWFRKPLNPEALLGELNATRATLSLAGAGR